ncbi:DUF6126 family protein [Streptomyces sp. Li-HN-5-11]|uniref:DUF6126 family protein n=1 Tax=Streptomyces sp. Li-HN-5-11 TaxID=3075432 RepID=UPI0028B24DAD|nr:DUF6126 family protein [Streptomyces sp. Li-HN-5-11]WNM31250.1 DUF6126 family protein [Streptomyces sp. Li-HN-5-11]
MTEQAPDESASKEQKRKTRLKDRDGWIERGVAIRVGFYIFGTHIIAAWVMLLFYLGDHAHK